MTIHRGMMAAALLVSMLAMSGFAMGQTGTRPDPPCGPAGIDENGNCREDARDVGARRPFEDYSQRLRGNEQTTPLDDTASSITKCTAFEGLVELMLRREEA